MRTVERALLSFQDKGMPAAICVQGTTLRLEKVLGVKEETVHCEVGGKPWVFDLDFVSGIRTAGPLPREPFYAPGERRSEYPEWIGTGKPAFLEGGQDKSRPAGAAAPLKDFLEGEEPLSDPALLCSLVEGLALPDFVQSESLWRFLKEEFHQNPACLSDVDKILDLMEEAEAEPENASLREKLLQTITAAAQAFPQSGSLFECLRARTKVLAGEKLEAAKILYEIGRLPECLAILGELLTPQTLFVGKLLFGYHFIHSYGASLSAFDQKLVLYYARLCETPEDAGVLVSLFQETPPGQEVDAAYPAAALYLIRKKLPGFVYDPQGGIPLLLENLREAWQIRRGTSFEEYMAVRRDGMNRFQGALTGNRTRHYEELEGRSFYQSDVDARFGSYAGYYQYWLEFQNGPMGKNSMYLNPHQIIDPLLAKCLARLPLSQAQRLGVIFVAGENSTRVAATCAFLAPGSRRTALDFLSAAQGNTQRNHLAFYLEFYHLQRSEEASMLRVFDKESLLSHRLSSPERALSDAQVYLFLHSVLRDVPQDRALPDAWESRQEVAKCALHLLSEREMPLRHLWLGRLIYALGKEGPLGQDFLVKGYCHGLPEEDPFYYPLWGGRSKEAIFGDCLLQMRQFRFLEAKEGFEEWCPKMLHKHRVDTPEKLKNASHRSQYALCVALKDYCQAVLARDGDAMEEKRQSLLAERSLTRSMKDRLEEVFARMEAAERK